MKLFSKLFALAVVVLGLSMTSKAATLNGQLSFAGSYTGAFGPSTITFSGNPVAVYGGTKDLASFNGAMGSVTYNYPSSVTISGYNVLFYVPVAGSTTGQYLAFAYTGTPQYTPAAGNSSATFTFTGILAEVQTSGTFGTQKCSTSAPCIISSNTSAMLTISPSGIGTGAYSATIIAPTPEPSSLLLLGTGLVGAAGIVVRKRRGTNGAVAAV